MTVRMTPAHKAAVRKLWKSHAFGHGAAHLHGGDYKHIPHPHHQQAPETAPGGLRHCHGCIFVAVRQVLCCVFIHNVSPIQRFVYRLHKRTQARRHWPDDVLMTFCKQAQRDENTPTPADCRSADREKCSSGEESGILRNRCCYSRQLRIPVELVIIRALLKISILFAAEARSHGRGFATIGSFDSCKTPRMAKQRRMRAKGHF